MYPLTIGIMLVYPLLFSSIGLYAISYHCVDERSKQLSPLTGLLRPHFRLLEIRQGGRGDSWAHWSPHSINVTGLQLSEV